MTTVDRLAYTLEDQALMARASRYFEWQARMIMPEIGDRIVEVGCGTGNFTRFLLDRELLIAVDIEPACVKQVRERFGDRAGLVTMVGSPGDAAFARVAQHRPECCVCLNVLEHIEDDVAALRSMASVLACGGTIVLLVPAFPALYGPIDRNLGHYRRYTRKSLRRAAEAANLSLLKLRYMNSAGFFGWLMNARVLKRERQSAGQIELFDRWVVPLVSRFDSFFHPPFGQSLIAVMQKR